MLTTIYYEREGDINGEKRKPRRQVKKRPATPHGAGYLFYHSGNCGGLPGFQHSGCAQSAGIWRPGSRWGSPDCTDLHCIRGAVAHCGRWDSVSMKNQLCFPHYKAPTGLPFEDGQR